MPGTSSQRLLGFLLRRDLCNGLLERRLIGSTESSPDCGRSKAGDKKRDCEHDKINGWPVLHIILLQ